MYTINEILEELKRSLTQEQTDLLISNLSMAIILEDNPDTLFDRFKEHEVSDAVWAAAIRVDGNHLSPDQIVAICLERRSDVTIDAAIASGKLSNEQQMHLKALKAA